MLHSHRFFSFKTFTTTFSFLLFTTIYLPATCFSEQLIDESANFQFRSAEARIKWLGGNINQAYPPQTTDQLNSYLVVDRDKSEEISIELNALDISSNIVFLLNSGNSKGKLDFYSKEHKSPRHHPILVISTNQNNYYLPPQADLTVNQSTFKSLGFLDTLSVGRKNQALLSFNIPDNVSQKKETIQSVVLKLTTTEKQFGDTEIVVIQLTESKSTRIASNKGIAATTLTSTALNKHPQVYFADSFDNSSTILSTLSSWVSDPSSPLVNKTNFELIDHQNVFKHSNGKAIAAHFTTDKHLALNFDYYFKENIGHEPEEAYFRYYMYLEHGAEISGGGKLPGFGGTYNKAGWGGRGNDGYSGWSARGAFTETVMNPKSPWYGSMPIGNYVYQVGKGKYGEVLSWGQSLSALKPGKWYCIEQRLKLNTPNIADGVMEAWIDGQKVFSHDDLHFRDTEDLKIEKIWFNFYFGGTSKPKHDFSIFIDDIVIAKSYIGPLPK